MAVYKEKFMKMAIDLAKKADGAVQPNPYVGAVVVKDNKVIAKGFHQKYGSLHAERIALNNTAKSAKGAELFVNLEPCSHNGKTPPCVDKIIEEKISKVYIGMVDPNPKVSGRGIKILKNHNIEVCEGVLNEQARKINRIFLTNIINKRPYFYLKYAMTADGYIASSTGNSKWISNEKSREYVHYRRHNMQAILVGSSTVIKDNPRLTARNIKEGWQPIPVILDMIGEIKNLDYNVFDREAILITSNNQIKETKNVKIYRIDRYDKKLYKKIIYIFNKEQIFSVMVEGGAKTLSFFIKNNLYDEIDVFISMKFIGDGISPTNFKGINNIKDGHELIGIDFKRFDNNILMKGFNKNVHWLN